VKGSQERTARTRQPEKDSQDRNARKRDSQNKIDRTEQAGEDPSIRPWVVLAVAKSPPQAEDGQVSFPHGPDQGIFQ
jgi:hypothetical protein